MDGAGLGRAWSWPAAANRLIGKRYLEDECQIATSGGNRYRAVLIHYEGNTRQERKNLPVEVAGPICEEVIRAGATPIILDWDRRTPLADGRRIRNPGPDHPLYYNRTRRPCPAPDSPEPRDAADSFSSRFREANRWTLLRMKENRATAPVNHAFLFPRVVQSEILICWPP
jgi:hypothetical protein